MLTVNLYSSGPTGTRVSLALLGLATLGMQVQLRPLSELPAAPKPCRRRASLRAELCEVCVELAAIGERLDEHDNGTWYLDAGTRQGLLYDRDARLSRKRAIEAALREEGGPGNG